MALILARSPFFVSNEGFDENALLTVEIGSENYNALLPGVEFIVEKTYTINFRKQTEVDIAPLVRSEMRIPADTTVPTNRQSDMVKRVRVTVSGSISGVAQSDVVASHTATSGYFDYEQGYNYDASDELLENAFYAGSNDVIYHLDDANFYVPIFNPRDEDYDVQVDFQYRGEVVRSTSTGMGWSNQFGSNDKQRYEKFQAWNISQQDFYDRVIADGGTIETSICTQDFYDQEKLFPVDRIVIKATDGAPGGSGIPTKTKFLDVVTIEECKYDPYKIEFKNKYGVLEELWFFKRSDKSLTTKREQYRRNVFDSYSSGNIDKHPYANFNVNGREMMRLNSGWLPESFYENFKQLYLSEEVWIYYKNKRIPVNLKSSDLQEQLHKNEKVINYELEVEFAFETIGSVV